ncbi:MAG: hypothetical protein A3F09_03005 [Chlamydiae bacterium RIFCSPHIGHO2_12_FULL_49_11]|nr:MAG: hypothetical protein A3F09_03005 [Chlamydiae bacterium RIFCSPHIGHO2_12_FULL_49_11]
MITRDRLAAWFTATMHPNGVQKVASEAEQSLINEATSEKVRQCVHDLLRHYSEIGWVVRLSQGLWIGTCGILVANVFVAPLNPPWGMAYGIITAAGLAGKLGIVTALMCNWSRAARAVDTEQLEGESEQIPLSPL